jgi:hypothetical protein|tara:strand:- start:919 stop:1302 length:384 start_codon:yes stop_codon:yes gene_type:complete
MEKSITLLLIKAVILTLSLDSLAKWEDWNNTDKNLFKMYVLGTTLDYMQTKNALENSYIEGNPFLGENPSSDRLLTQKVLSAGAVYWSMNTIKYKPYRRRGLLIVNGIQWGVVIRNEQVGATFIYRW